jgi:D-arabinose 1-dehydrogenase-like Zn-dependent alcohol dehydrogenase
MAKAAQTAESCFKSKIRVTYLRWPGADPVMREVPWPKVPPKGALIQIAPAACAARPAHPQGHWPKPLPWPFTLGHELAGVIVEIGSSSRPITWASRSASAPR